MTCKGVFGLLTGRECFRTTGRFTARTLYPAVVIDETQPLHGHVSHMTPPEQDFAWRGKEKGQTQRIKTQGKAKDKQGKVWCYVGEIRGTNSRETDERKKLERAKKEEICVRFSAEAVKTWWCSFQMNQQMSVFCRSIIKKVSFFKQNFVVYLINVDFL